MHQYLQSLNTCTSCVCIISKTELFGKINPTTNYGIMPHQIAFQPIKESQIESDNVVNRKSLLYTRGVLPCIKAKLSKGNKKEIWQVSMMLGFNSKLFV